MIVKVGAVIKYVFCRFTRTPFLPRSLTAASPRSYHRAVISRSDGHSIFLSRIKNKARKRNCSNVSKNFGTKEKVFSRSRGKDFFRRASYPGNKKRRGSKMIQSSRIILTRTALCSPTINGTALVRIENDTVIPSSFRLARRLVVQPVKVPSACSNRVLIQLCGYYSTIFRVCQ